MPIRITHLPKKELSSSEFKVVRTPYFSLKAKRSGREGARIGVIAGKAASPTAVGRNFLKRQARATIANAARAGSDWLLIFSPAARKLSKTVLRKTIRSAAEKLLH